jgi:hypothetical protein
MPSLKPPTLPSAQVFNGMLGVLGNKAGNEVANYQVFNEVSPKKVLYNRRLHKVMRHMMPTSNNSCHVSWVWVVRRWSHSPKTLTVSPMLEVCFSSRAWSGKPPTEGYYGTVG